MLRDVLSGIVNELNSIVIKFCQTSKVGIPALGRERVDALVAVVEVGKQGVGS